ncbi:hypothetical protein D3C81_10430 [compost metagenome]
MIVVKKSLGQRINTISHKTNIPKITVERVIKEYLESLKASIEAGEDIVLDGVVSMKSYVDEETEEIIIRSRASAALKGKINKKAFKLEE